MEGILRAVADHPEAAACWVLRGGVLSQWWCLPYPRPADDIDFLATYPFDQARTDALIDALPGVARAADTEVIWAETASPGLRYQLAVFGEIVQCDLGFGDPMDPPPVWWSYPSLTPPAPRLQVIRPELGLAWKLHGLFEQEDGHWRPKDLHDLWLFLRHAPLEARLLPGAIRLAFESRRTPLWAADRLLAEELGRSRTSQKRWARLQRARPEVPDLRTTVAAVARALSPILEGLHPAHATAADENGDPASPFPVITQLDDILPAIEGDRCFRLYDRGFYKILNAERSSADAFPGPTPLCSERIRRYRQLRRECRGLVFAADGRLLARRYHKIFPLGEREESQIAWLSPPFLVLEKLDGALLCPAVLPEAGGIRLLSRRGISPISESAERFAGAGHWSLWASLLEAGWTPLLEWCHDDHRVVVGHPQPRLVLTGVRHTRSGRYLAREAVAALGARYGVEVVASRGWVTDLRSLVGLVEAEEDGEGVVVWGTDGPVAKLKTLRYRRLHRALEATERERARWEILLHGEAALLCALLPAEEAAAFSALEVHVRGTVARRAAVLAEEAQAHRAGGGTVGSLGARAVSLPGPERAALFAAWRGEDAEAALWSAIRRSAEGGRGLADLRRWLTPDGCSDRS